MKYKDKPLGGLELKVYAEMASGFLTIWRRQLSWILGRYKLLFLGFAFTLILWTLVGNHSVDDNYVEKSFIERKKVKEFKDFDYKYESGDKLQGNNVEYSDNGARKSEFNVDRIQRQKDKIKSDNEEIKESLIISNTADDNNPIKDIEKDEVKPSKLSVHHFQSKGNINTLNGVKFHINDDVDWAAVGGADIFNSNSASLGHNEFAEDEAKIIPGLGERGEPVVLSGKEASLAENIMKTEAFNLLVSDRISYTREIPDTRDGRCKSVFYEDDLPTTSVIIIFTNEAWSPLIRTIYSVLNRSPAHLVHEIILVDDFSDKSHLKGKLERYIRRYFPSKVKLMRLKKREGLIRARLAGARAATGDVILFLDSHCECNEGWLEPLLARIHENPLAFVVPIIDVIDDKTLEYYHGNGNYFQVGGFTWSGHFTWVDISQSEMTRRGSPIAPTRSPTMAGGLFAVSRDTFWSLGSYDEEMDVWGGENLEMSFRIWQCGGVLETIPCSRVGHIFRSFHPYSFPGNKDTHGINTARTVEVWMEDYKRLFYMNRPDLLNSQIGSLERRFEFKEEHNCKPFSWFLENIYPEKFVLDAPEQVYAYGRLKNPHNNVCLDNLQNDDKDNYDLGQYVCHNFMAAAQFFSFSRKFELRREDTCATVTNPFPGPREKVEMSTCHGQGGDQEWAHTKEGKIIHKSTKKCLDTGYGQSMELLYVAPCQNIPSQVWYFDHYIN